MLIIYLFININREF